MSRNRNVPIATALIVDDDFDDMMSINNNNDKHGNDNNNYSDDQFCIAPTARDSFTSSFYNYNYDSDDNCNDNSGSKKMFSTKTNARNIKSVSQKYHDNNSNNYYHQLFKGTTTSEPVTASSKSMSFKLKKSPSQHSSTPKYSSTPTTSTKIFTEGKLNNFIM